jgi:hypothetical protein
VNPSSTTSVFNFVPLTTGVYFIYCEVHSCDTCDWQPPVNSPTAPSNLFTVNSVICSGVNETEANPSLNIFPNPADGTINLQWEGARGKESLVYVSDYTGRIISEYKTNENTLSIEDAGLKSGVYFVTIKTGDRIFHAPVVIR